MARKLIVLIAVLATLVFAAPSMAAGTDPYKGAGGKVQTGIDRKGSKGTGTLPFTGLDIAFLVGGGLILVLAGGAVRRLGGERAPR